MEHKCGINLSGLSTLRTLPLTKQLWFPGTPLFVGQLQTTRCLRIVVRIVKSITISNDQIVSSLRVAQENQNAQRLTNVDGLDQWLNSREPSALNIQPAVDTPTGGWHIDHFQLVDNERFENDCPLIDVVFDQGS